MRRRWIIILSIVFGVGIMAIWILSSPPEPIPPGLAQETALLTDFARERLLQGNTNCFLTISLGTDNRHAWIRAAFTNKCISYTVRKLNTDTKWQLMGQAVWTVPTPLMQTDVAEITRLARTDYHGMTTVSWIKVRQLPKALARHWSFHVLSIDGTGTVAEVRVGNSQRGYTYRLQKGPTGWLIVEKNAWASLPVK